MANLLPDVGTFLGPLPTPAGPVAQTGAKVSIPTADFFYLRDGKIETFNCYLSMNIMLAQMGSIPTSHPPRSRRPPLTELHRTGPWRESLRSRSA